jgi:hypothetical protein
MAIKSPWEKASISGWNQELTCPFELFWYTHNSQAEICGHGV